MTSVTADRHEAAARAPRGFGLLLRLLASNWTVGRLTVLLPGGTRHMLEGQQPGPSGTLDIRDLRFARRVLASGDIGFAEGYMAGEWETPHLAALLEALARNGDHIRRLMVGNRIMKTVHWLSHRMHRNSRAGSRKNIHAHYDIGNSFYSAWLDRTMTYSSARFSRAGLTLEAAQREKYAALARTMDLRAGQSVLEIGCGWGGFAEFAAREVGANVTGITISREQYDYARQRIFNAGLSEKVDLQLIDYRDVSGRFDRVASIEMFEAVGEEYWPAYFGKIHDVLEPGGRAGLQIITIEDDAFAGYRKRTDFIQKYIFPGGMLPSEAALGPIVAAAGLDRGAVDRFGQDYAETLRLWDERFQAAWEDIRRPGGFDERFRRLWRFYLAYCEAGFRIGRTNVIQLGLSRV